MNEISDIRRLFDDKNNCTLFIKSMFEEELQKANLSEDEQTHLRYISETLIKINIDLIDKYCESPIEKTFLLSTFITSIKMNLVGFIFTPPVLDTENFLESFYENIGFLVNDFNEFSKTTGGNLKEYEKYIIENNQMSELQKMKLNTDLIMYIGFDFYHQFHVLIQPTFSTVSRKNKKIRADLLIWRPSDKSVKVVVECDGYEFHKDKTHFIEDRKRDRDFKNKNFDVLRFSGTEIYNSFIDVSYEIVDSVYSNYGKS